MAGPTVNIKILADASQAAKTMDTASGRMSKFAGKMKSAALPIAAAGAALVGMGKSAVEDAAGQAALAKALQKTTGATTDQVSAVESWINKTSQATGVADDDLRPALATLARATGSVSTAQSAMGTAMDVAAATGKPLAAVTAALAKGYGGNAGALGKLVPGLDKGVLATKDMSKITAELARLTGGSAAAAAQTSAGQFKRMTLALDETQESIGGALLPALTALAPMLQRIATFMQNNAGVVGPLVIGLGALAAVIWVVNAAMAANPFVWWVVALAALIAAVVIAYKKVAWFRTAVQTYIKAVIAVWRALAAAVMVAVRAIAASAVWLWTNVLRPVVGAIITYVRTMVNAWRVAAAGIGVAIRAVATAARWLWTNALRPVINFIIGGFNLWWTAAVTTKNKIVATWQTTWNTAQTLKTKIVAAFSALASAIAGPFNAVGTAVSGAMAWLQKLYDKLNIFKPPKWLTSVFGKVGDAIGFAAPPAGPAYARSPVLRLGAPAGRAAGRAGTATGRVGGTASTAESGTAATLSHLLGANAQVVVHVSDRKMANMIDVQIRDNATAATRSLTRRSVVIV